MSSLSLTKPISFKRSKAATSAEALPEIASGVIAATGPSLGLGGIPRANLLPPSVIADQHGKRTVRRMFAAVVLSVVVVLIGAGAAGVLAASKGSALEDARAETDALIAQQAAYSDVSVALAGIDTLTAAQAAVGATDVLWADYLGLVRATLPEGMTLSGAVIQAATPTTALTAGTSVLSATGAASIELTVKSGDLSAVQAWLDRLTTLPGYSEALLGTVTRDETGALQTTVSLDLTDAIYSGRFAQEVAQ